MEKDIKSDYVNSNSVKTETSNALPIQSVPAEKVEIKGAVEGLSIEDKIFFENKFHGEVILEEVYAGLFKEELKDTVKAQQLYASLCNTAWRIGTETYTVSWRTAGAIVSEARNDLKLDVVPDNLCARCNKDYDDHEVVETEHSFPWEKSNKTWTIKSAYCNPCDERGEEEPDEKHQEGASDKPREEFLSGYTHTEDYMDFYCSGNEGIVEPWIREKLRTAGFEEDLNYYSSDE